MVNAGVRRSGREASHEALRWVSWQELDDGARTRIRLGKEG